MTECHPLVHPHSHRDGHSLNIPIVTRQMARGLTDISRSSIIYYFPQRYIRLHNLTTLSSKLIFHSNAPLPNLSNSLVYIHQVSRHNFLARGKRPERIFIAFSCLFCQVPIRTYDTTIIFSYVFSTRIIQHLLVFTTNTLTFFEMFVCVYLWMKFECINIK